MNKFNFKSFGGEKCVFFGEVNDVLVYLAIYVDDGLVLCVSLFIIKIVLQYLREHFEINEDAPSEFIGIEIKRDRGSGELKVTQLHYIDKTVAKFEMNYANSVSLPLD